MLPKNIRITDYNYDLPDERIAKYPLAERDASKLLTFQDGVISESIFKHLPTQLPKDSFLVFNMTKVIRARLQFQKPTGAIIEIFCLEPYEPTDYAMALQTTQSCEWKCLVGNLKRWKEDKINLTVTHNGEECKLSAQIKERTKDAFIISFSWDKPFTFSEILEYSGAIPIPPYLNRKSETIDTERYQTVFSKIEGSVAAPTAGLHFTPEVLAQLAQNNIQTGQLTLHVGAGTFKPVKSETVGDHHMHTEVFSFSKALLNNLLENDTIIAVGTTSVRSLESIYQIGAKLLSQSPTPLHIRQWEAYELPSYSQKEAIRAVLNYMESENTEQLTAKTDILIAPSYNFKIISGMLTNFHQPQSTLLLLVAALVGKDWKKIYNYALANDYRFLSYGDSSLLLAPRNI